MKESMELELGGERVAVSAENSVPEEKPTGESQRLADQILAALKHNIPFWPGMFQAVSDKEIIAALDAAFPAYDVHRVGEGQELLSPCRREQRVLALCGSIAEEVRLLISHNVLTRGLMARWGQVRTAVFQMTQDGQPEFSPVGDCYTTLGQTQGIILEPRGYANSPQLHARSFGFWYDSEGGEYRLGGPAHAIWSRDCLRAPSRKDDGSLLGLVRLYGRKRTAEISRVVLGMLRAMEASREYAEIGYSIKRQARKHGVHYGKACEMPEAQQGLAEQRWLLTLFRGMDSMTEEGFRLPQPLLAFKISSPPPSFIKEEVRELYKGLRVCKDPSWIRSEIWDLCSSDGTEIFGTEDLDPDGNARNYASRDVLDFGRIFADRRDMFYGNRSVTFDGNDGEQVRLLADEVFRLSQEDYEGKVALRHLPQVRVMDFNGPRIDPDQFRFVSGDIRAEIAREDWPNKPCRKKN